MNYYLNEELTMIDFDFQIKTKIYFGKGKENLVGEILKKEGASKIVLVVGQNSVFSSYSQWQ